MVFDPEKQLPSGTSTTNDELFDAMVRHQIFLLRSVGTLRNETIRLLDLTERDIVSAITRHLAGTEGNLPKGLRRAATLQQILAKIRGETWGEVTRIWREQMDELAVKEPRFVGEILTRVSPVQLELAFPSAARLKSIVATRPFEGKTLAEWSRDIRRSDLKRIEDQIKIGLVQGEASPQIARRIVGRRLLRGQDGVLQLTRNGAAALTRTMTNAMANFSRREFFQANQGLMTGELYVATLDGRTTAICRSLDGRVFDVGEGPIPPLHFNCRSLRTGVFNGQVLGRRPMKPVTEKQLLREFSANRGLRSITRRSQLPRGTKTAFDKFSRRRIREIVGTVPAKVAYPEFLIRQSVQFQEDTLGVIKSRLFRKGGLTLDKFVAPDGSELTIAEIATKNRQAFIDAGLDPAQF